MYKVNLIIADDEAHIHQDIRDSLDSMNVDYQILEDFDNTRDLMDYLWDLIDEEADEVDYPDILLLDHDFAGNGVNGLDRIPEIREILPNLPILMLTGSAFPMFETSQEKYNFSYIQKPINSNNLYFQIKDTVKRMKDMDVLEGMLRDYEEQLQNMVEPVKVFPPDILKLIQNVFPDLEFLPRSFELLAKALDNKKDWNRMFKCLKLIDWKNEQNAPAGVNVQKYTQAKHENTWEYRFSQAGRIFVQRRNKDNPLVLLIDPKHSYSDMPAWL